LHGGFKAGHAFGFVFEDDAIEVAGEIGEDAVFAELGNGGGFLDLRGEFGGLTWFGDEAIADNDHEMLLESLSVPRNRGSASGAGMIPPQAVLSPATETLARTSNG